VDTFLDEAEEKIFAIKEDQAGQVVFTLDELVPDEVSRIESNFETKREVLGIASGFVDLDKLTGGFQDADLILIAARPSMGKTALGLNIGFHAARSQVPTLFFSLEQPKEQLVQRLMASAGQINAWRLRTSRLKQDEWDKLIDIDSLLNGPFYIIDRPALTPMEIRAHARRLKNKHGIGLVILDYLQLAREPKAKSREQEVGGISRALKALAKELDVPVIALSQLNRDLEKRPNKQPVLSDLRESGSLEQDADLVLFIYRDEVYNENSKDKGLAEIHLAKQRNGPTGRIKLTYRKEFMQFRNYIPEV
jgi:replicative DNA helicase